MSYCDYIRSDKAREPHIAYHDTEYGFPVTDDVALFERLVLEINQAGLSWETVLKKRAAFRAAYDGFDIAKVARYGEAEVARLLADAGIIRNRLKVAAAIHNARVIEGLQREHGSFGAWLDAHHPKSKTEWVKLFKQTFRFTGGEIVGEFLMSLGYLPGAHDDDCPVGRHIQTLAPAWSRSVEPAADGGTGPSRRAFLARAAGATQALRARPLARHPERDAPLPEGVIAPYDWGRRPIPATGPAAKGFEPIDAAVMDAMRRHGIVGCGVSIVRETEVVFARGYGFAELDGAPFAGTTAARCGSLAKPVTALCALLLADRKELDLDAPILPILKAAGIAPTPIGGFHTDARIERITVRHLLDHTSGLPRSATYTAWRPNRDLIGLYGLKRVPTGADVAADGLGNTTLASEPGTRFEYANANFVLLARIIEARSKTRFGAFLTRVAMPAFGVSPDQVFVSRNQTEVRSAARGANEAAYYQTSAERYGSFLPDDHERGAVFGEAYRGYATEASDGAGGIACSAEALGHIIAALHLRKPPLSARALGEITTPPTHYSAVPGFDPASAGYYSKGFEVRYSGGRPWLSHSGMTNHCGGVIGHNAGYQFVGVSNWNAPQARYVDRMLDEALAGAVAKLGARR